VSGLVAVAALVIAGVSLLLGPIAILAALGLAYLAVGRRRRAARKHEGLRVLR
jgi:Flp pilus assembly protein TadB